MYKAYFTKDLNNKFEYINKLINTTNCSNVVYFCPKKYKELAEKNIKNAYIFFYEDINKNNEYFNLLSVVFQDFGILPLSIKDNITFGFEENNNLLNALEQSGLDKIINKLKYKEDTYLIKEINAEAVNLSGGEIQRLLLARALYKNFKILILDEPTAALDAIAEDELYKKYSEFSKEKISIFISHRLSSTKFCDRILYLSNGKIESIGTHEELLKHSIKYKQMYYAQSKYYK